MFSVRHQFRRAVSPLTSRQYCQRLCSAHSADRSVSSECARGTTDPGAIRELAESIPSLRITHLPRVHAKVFVQDPQSAIVTSGNLTAGGLESNYQYGILISDRTLAGGIEDDIHDYTALGVDVSKVAIEEYSEQGAKLRDLYSSQQIQSRLAAPELQQALTK